jgi:hypothetical protein
MAFLMCFFSGPADKNSGKTDLMKVPMAITDWNKCAKVFSKLTKNMLCAGFENKSYDACQVTGAPPSAYRPHPICCQVTRGTPQLTGCALDAARARGSSLPKKKQ